MPAMSSTRQPKNAHSDVMVRLSRRFTPSASRPMAPPMPPRLPKRRRESPSRLNAFCSMVFMFDKPRLFFICQRLPDIQNIKYCLKYYSTNIITQNQTNRKPARERVLLHFQGNFGFCVYQIILLGVIMIKKHNWGKNSQHDNRRHMRRQRQRQEHPCEGNRGLPYLHLGNNRPGLLLQGPFRPAL